MTPRKGECFPNVSAKSPTVGKGLTTIHPRAAGIDAHSREHYVAVAEGSAPGRTSAEAADTNLPPHVRVFGTNTGDLETLASWLVECGVTTVAVESTGVYHMAVVEVVQRHGIEIIVVDSRQTANAPGRPKTDVLDCQWIQRLHSYGLLRASFVPGPEIRKLRAYERQRGTLVRGAATQIQHMQKALEMMNCKLTETVTDIVGATGMLIIQAILRGTRDPLKLAKFRHKNCKASEAELAAALKGTWQEEYIFELRQALKLYQEYRRQLRACEDEIEACLKTFADRSEGKTPEPRARKRGKSKNAVQFDARTLLLKMSGMDVTVLEGIDETTALILLSELGYDLSMFPSARHFTSWLGLCPNHRGSGGKLKRRKVKPSANRANRAFRLAASGCHHAKNAMGAFYRRIASKAGGAKAIVATARKIAERFYNLLTKNEKYVRQGESEYERTYRLKLMKGLTKRAQEMGYQLVPITAAQ